MFFFIFVKAETNRLVLGESGISLLILHVPVSEPAFIALYKKQRHQKICGMLPGKKHERPV